MTQIIVINLGSQYIHLIARRIRELGVHSEIRPFDVHVDEIKKLKPKGIILSGGPSSVFEKNAPIIDKRFLELGVPVIGICYGLQLIAHLTGGNVRTKKKEYGKRTLSLKKKSILLDGLDKKEHVWMSHGDSVLGLPEGFDVVAETESCKIAAFENNEKKIYGLQFHPEVVHTKNGMKVLRNFVFNICKAKKDWAMGDIGKKLVDEIKEEVGSHAVIMGTSGGVDSTVAAFLIHKAIGERIHCVFIDHGLIRKNEADEIRDMFKKKFHFRNFHFVDASKIFLKKLEGVKDPEEKRKIIGHTFIEVFEKKAKELEKKHPNIKYLGQGTIYPDRIESAQPSKQADKIKSHHNITLPEKMDLKILEPISELYKDEVRELGKAIHVPKQILERHPFPGPGLAIRILGEITQERLNILRESDYIFIEELKKSGYYNKTWQALAALLPVKTVGVMGDARTYEYIISLRAVTSKDAMTADWARIPNDLLEKISSRIVNEVKGVNRVVYDITQKPPSTIEYE